MLKRIFDIVISLIGLLVLFPFLFLIAIAIKADSSGPLFFRQSRVGQFGKMFKIFKFRTMVTQAEKIGAEITSCDDPRVTKFGGVLRRYKVDELPQLVNVLKGEMSLVGPRPEIPKFVAVYQDDFNDILRVKPGITDFASLEYSNENELLKASEDPEQKYLNEILPVKICFYKKYLNEQSLKTDLTLIFKTLLKIIR